MFPIVGAGLVFLIISVITGLFGFGVFSGDAPLAAKLWSAFFNPPGWRAGAPGVQIVRLVSDRPQQVRRIWLHFAEPAVARTQEFVLRWGTAGAQPSREIVRQQWVFHPKGSTHEAEDYRVDLDGVTLLELAIIPDMVGGRGPGFPGGNACRVTARMKSLKTK